MKIGHFPQHVGHFIEHNLRSTKTLNVRSGGYTEMDPGPFSYVPAMRRILAPATIFTDSDKDKDPGKHSQEVPIAGRTSRRHKVTNSRTVMLSPDLGVGIHNDRHMTIVEWQVGFLRKRRWAHIATHLNAGIQNPDTGLMHQNTAVLVTEEAVIAIEDEIDSLVNRGFEVVLSGDFNWRVHEGVTPWKYSPISVAARHHMKIYSNGLDHILWTRGLRQMKVPAVYSRNTDFNMSDHPWTVLTLAFKLP